jgi:hypothetical protein
MRLATRPLRWLLPLLLLAAVPVSLVALRGERWDDCADPEALSRIGAVLEGEPAEFQPFYRSHVFHRHEGNLPVGPKLPPFRYRIVRSDEPRYPFEQPTRFLQVPMNPERSVVRLIEADGRSVPVHFDYAHFAEALRVAGSIYVYDGQPVDALLPLQVRSAWTQLVRGRRPITLFQIHGHGPSAARTEIEDRQIAWLLSAWSAYRDVCAGEPAS